MENSFGSSGLFGGPTGDNKDLVKIQTADEETPKFKWEWRSFIAYGCIWIVIFFGFLCVQRVVGVILEQQRIIQELIDKQKQWENPDITDDDEEQDSTYAELSSWVKKNLPTKGVDERPAVAEVFNNLAEMLDEGELIGEDDAFSEGIAQLQPVATRSIWLPFLTKLTKRLKKAKYDAAGLANACRTVSKAIYPTKRAAIILAESAIDVKAQNCPSDAQDGKNDKLAVSATNPSLIAPEGPKKEDKPEPAETNAEKAKSCPTGNCPNAQGAYSGYGLKWYGQ